MSRHRFGRPTRPEEHDDPELWRHQFGRRPRRWRAILRGAGLDASTIRLWARNANRGRRFGGYGNSAEDKIRRAVDWLTTPSVSPRLLVAEAQARLGAEARLGVDLDELLVAPLRRPTRPDIIIAGPALLDAIALTLGDPPPQTAGYVNYLGGIDPVAPDATASGSACVARPRRGTLPP